MSAPDRVLSHRHPDDSPSYNATRLAEFTSNRIRRTALRRLGQGRSSSARRATSARRLSTTIRRYTEGDQPVSRRNQWQKDSTQVNPRIAPTSLIDRGTSDERSTLARARQRFRRTSLNELPASLRTALAIVAGLTPQALATSERVAIGNRRIVLAEAYSPSLLLYDLDSVRSRAVRFPNSKWDAEVFERRWRNRSAQDSTRAFQERIRSSLRRFTKVFPLPSGRLVIYDVDNAQRTQELLLFSPGTLTAARVDRSLGRLQSTSGRSYDLFDGVVGHSSTGLIGVVPNDEAIDAFRHIFAELESCRGPEAYVSILQEKSTASVLFVLLRGRSLSMNAAEVQHVTAEAAPQLAIRRIFVLSDEARRSVETLRRAATFFGVVAVLGVFASCFAACATALSLADVRRRELGVRMALGASTFAIAETVLRPLMQAGALATAGGIAVGIGVSRWLAAIDPDVAGASPAGLLLSILGIVLPLLFSGVAVAVAWRRRPPSELIRDS